MSEKLWYLQRCDLFERLSPQELEQLESECRVRSFPANLPLDLPRDEGAAYVLVAGSARIFRTDTEGNSTPLASLSVGDLFGHLAGLGDAGPQEIIETRASTTVAMLSQESVKRLALTHPYVTLRRTELLGLRRIRVERLLADLLFRSARDRLASWMLELAERAGHRVREGVKVRGAISYGKLACAIGGPRRAVAAGLAELQANGSILIEGRSVIIRQPERLIIHEHSVVPRPLGLSSQQSSAFHRG